jgi:hypothetical protein
MHLHGEWHMCQRHLSRLILKLQNAEYRYDKCCIGHTSQKFSFQRSSEENRGQQRRVFVYIISKETKKSELDYCYLVDFRQPCSLFDRSVRPSDICIAKMPADNTTASVSPRPGDVRRNDLESRTLAYPSISKHLSIGRSYDAAEKLYNAFQQAFEHFNVDMFAANNTFRFAPLRKKTSRDTILMN